MKKLFTIFGTVLFSMVFLTVCCITTTYAQNWTQVNTDGFGGAVNNENAPLIEYKNMLYVAVDNIGGATQIWRTAAVGGPPFTDWTQVNADGFGDENNGSANLAVYNNFLYLAVSNEVTGCEVWRTAAVGGPPFTDWTQVNADGFGDENNGSADLAVYNNSLYAVTGDEFEVTGCEVWRTAAVGGPPFTDWAQVNTDGFGDGNNHGGTLGVYNNFLYVVTGDNEVTGCEVWRTAAVGGPPFTDWTQVNADGFGDGNNQGGVLGEYNNFLYVVTTGNEVEVWRTAAVGGPPFTDWIQANTDGFGDAGNIWAEKPVVYKNCLYIAVENSAGAEVWKTAAVGGPPFTDWTQINTNGFGDINNYAVWLAVYNNALYLATSNEITGAEVWQYSDDTGNELAVDFDTYGLWHYSGSSWTHLATWNPDGLAEWNGGLAVDFDTNGLWNYDGTTWTNLAAWNPENDANYGIAWNNDLVVDFGTNGLWSYDGSSWTSLAGWNPDGISEWTGGLAVNFGATNGLWNYDGTTWTQLAAWESEYEIAWNNDLAVDFDTNGLWSYDGTTWTNLAAWNPDLMVEWTGGLAVDFDTYGTWNYDGTTWSQLAGWNPEGDMVSWTDGLAVDFGPNGLWSYDGSSWTSLAGWNPEELEAWANGLAVDFGASYGLWNYDGSSWSNLAGWDSEDLIDVDLY